MYEKYQDAHKILLGGAGQIRKSLLIHMRRIKLVPNLYFLAIHLHQFY